MKLLFAGLLLTSSLLAQTNLMIPVLTCQLTETKIQELKTNGTYANESLTLIADFENVMALKSGKAVLLYHGSEVGAVDDIKEPGKVGGAELGTFSPGPITEDGFKPGTLFVGDLVTYNHKYKWTSELIVKDVSDQDNIIVELLKKNEGEGGSEGNISSTYNCQWSP